MILARGQGIRTAWVAVIVTVALLVMAAGPPPVTDRDGDFRGRLAAAAVERSHHVVRYDPSYVRIPFPNGDVPANTGVCSDEIIRIYRALGIDLQKAVYEDITRDPAAYGKHHADSNIDHRRVENLRVFFRRHGESLPITTNPADFQPGDLVTWDLHSGKGKILEHIGMVVDRQALLSKRYRILHNIGDGPQIEDVLFAWKITGHFRYYGPIGQHEVRSAASGSASAGLQSAR